MMHFLMLALRAACLLSMALWVGLGCSSLLGLETDRSLDTVYPIGGYEGCNAHGCDRCNTAYHGCVCTARRANPAADEYQLAASCFLNTRDPYPSCAEGHECDGCGDVLTRCLCEQGASAQAECVRQAKNTADGGTDSGTEAGPETGPDAGPLSCETDPPDACFTCRCEECRSEFTTCLDDAGCGEVLDCAAATDCLVLPVAGSLSDPTHCYQPDNCQAEIDAVGGPDGASYQALLDLLDCAAYAECPECEGAECSAPDCSGCADACDECVCLGGTPEECGCVDPPPPCEYPQCNCGSCLDSCMCHLNDATFCGELCGDDCSTGDGCGCANSIGACVCETGALGSCLAELGACHPPLCNCGGCVEDCTCATGDAASCSEICATGTLSCPTGTACEPHVRVVPGYPPLNYAACCGEGYFCGVDVGNQGYCSPADQPGTYTDACPPLPGDDEFFGLLGCCQANGVCGYDASSLGLGCADPYLFDMEPSGNCVAGPVPTP